MALRYSLPAGVGDVRPKSELTVPPFMRQPETVEFRRGANMAAVAAEIKGLVSVRVDAAVGAGKSTLLPKELALAYKSLVFHVVPNRLLAVSLYRYVAKCADSAAGYPVLELFSSYEQEVPRMGVMFMSCAEFVGLMIRESGLQRFPDCVVYLDEAHESDAYTHVIRNLSLSLGAGVLVQASATFGGGNFRARESVGKVLEYTYPAEKVLETWDPSDAKEPWGFAGIQNNILVYTDSRAQYKKLASVYEPAGFKVHRLEVGMDQSRYDLAMADLTNKRGPLVMLVAEYSFRWGFTCYVGTIIDSGRMSYYDPTPGKLLKKSRQIFKFEAEQGAGRGGRFEGLVTKYYRPDIELESVVCELEGVELEGAAYIYRVLGYQPVRELSRAVMAAYDLPKAVAFTAAMNGVYPLTYYVVDSTGSVRASALAAELAPLAPKDKPPEYVKEAADELLSDANPGMATDDCESDSGDKSSEAGSDAGSAGTAEQDVGASLWDAIIGGGGADAVLDVPLGNLCTIRGISKDEDGKSAVFPRGLDTVLRLFGGGGITSAVALQPRDRAAALFLVLQRYNVCAVEILAAGKALLARSAEIVRACDSPVAKRYFAEVVEVVAGYDLERSTLYSVLRKLETPRMYAEALRGAEEFVARRAAQYDREFVKAFDVPDYDDGGARLSLEESLRGVPTMFRSGNSHLVTGREYDLASERVRSARGLDGVREGKQGVRFADAVEFCDADTESEKVYLRRRRRHKTGALSEFVVKPPKWLGFKDVTYRASKAGEVSQMVIRPGKFLRTVANLKEEYHHH